MKSVGEVMAIGRTFTESLQKALRGLETGLTGLDEIDIPEGLGEGDDKNAIRAAISRRRRTGCSRSPRPCASACDRRQVHASCKIDPWFLEQMRQIIDHGSAHPRAHGLPKDNAEWMRMLKAMGFSDASGWRPDRQSEEAETSPSCATRWNVRPVYKRIDTCAAEFASPTAYMYSTYENPFGMARRPTKPTVRPQEGRHPRRRPEPDRPGHRVRLLLLPCRLRAGRTPATKRSWSTATRRRCPPTTTPPTGSISSR
jgi:carbamoyl-phosphate synthase large subunit